MLAARAHLPTAAVSPANEQNRLQRGPLYEGWFPNHPVVLEIEELRVTLRAEVQLHEEVAAKVIAPTAD